MALSLFTEHLSLSSEFGALCAGVLIANTDFSKKTHHAIEDWKDIFLMFFFIETGMHINLSILKENFFIIFLGTLSFIIIRIGSTLLGKFFSSISTRRIFILSLVFCNVSETGFLIIQYLFKTNHISEVYYEIILIIFLLSLFLSPFFLIIAKKLQKEEDNKLQSFDSTRVVIVGVNKYTYELAKMFKKQHIHFSIIDKNVDKIVNIRNLGYKAYLVDFFSFQNKLYFDNLDLLILTYNTKKDIYRIIEIKEDYPNLEIICLCSDERSYNLLTTYNINCVKIPAQETLDYIIGLSTPFINKFNSYGDYRGYE